ncbi:DUF5597 domain-containing protein [Cloacibacterium sp.]|uniref:GH35 family beta-galactosidase n=1 Tax=Cloacibacterium sp. TaxID=1913682 RepID=UPI0039E5C9BF
MKKFKIFATLLLLLSISNCFFGQNQIPHLEKTGNKQQLIVNNQPFIILGGELGNSTATTMESMENVWEKLKLMNMNTLLTPVYWELLEPEEGKFDFTLIDDLIFEARKQNYKLVFLWFGSWKNSMSSHAPAWVKLDTKKYPRTKNETGENQEILTPFSENNLKADLNAYQQLLRHIKEVDSKEQTVIMIQTENEIGMLPSARDYHPLATEKFNQQVPKDLMNYLSKNKNILNPDLLNIWKNNGFKTKGNWEEIFGKGLQTDEIFMAYYFAKYTNEISSAGKKEYAIPSFVNAALNRPGKKPGEYPSAGPLPHILDIWKAASPSIDLYSPDFYNPDFKHWCDLYTKQNETLFIPEHQFNNSIAAKALYAIGHYQALGFSPFNPEQTDHPKEEKLTKAYEAIAQIKPLLDTNWGKNKIEGILLDKDNRDATFTLGNYEFKAQHTFNLGWEPNSKAENWETAGGIIIQTGENEFYFVGFGVSLTMKNTKNPNKKVGILKTDKGYFKDGKWTVLQHLNGDQTHQGRHIRSFVDDFSIQRFTLYNY